jgi:branched-chain amino acid aminotransferase
MPEPLVYLNGQLVPASQAHIAIFDLGLVQGAAVTEMTRTFRHRPWRLDAHLDRLYSSLRYTRIDIGLAKEELAAISEEVVASNARLIHPEDELGVIQFVTPGEHRTYGGPAVRTTPTVCVHTFPLPFELWADKMRTGAHVVTPSVRHVPPECWAPTIKCRSRMHFYLADREALLVDPEAVALLLDAHGNVTETNAANVFIVDKGTLASPTTVNTLPGVSRAMVIELAGQLEIPFSERDLQVHDVLHADEAFLTSTPYCMMPVTRINGVPIGAGNPGSMFQRVLRAWSDAVGLDIAAQMETARRRTLSV